MNWLFETRLRGDVVAEREREREDRARDDGGEGERQDHPAEGRAGPRAEVAGRLEERRRDPLEPGVDRQDHERQPDVAEHDRDGDVARIEDDARDPDLLERPFERPAPGEDHAPRVHADEVARPQRQQHEHEHHGARARAGGAGHVVRDGEGEDRVDDRDQRRHPDGPERDRPVDGVGEQLLEVLERELVGHRRRQRVQVPEGRHEQHDQRAEVDEAEPAHRRRQEQQHLERPMAVDEPVQAPPQAVRRRGKGARRHGDAGR